MRKRTWARPVDGVAAFLGQLQRRQQGASLIVSLLMLIAVAMLGMSAAQVALQDSKAARNEADRQIAMQSAEAALSDAELDIETGERKEIFTPGKLEVLSAECGNAQVDRCRGVYRHAERGHPPVWQTADLASDAESVSYGYFTGQIFQTGEGLRPARLPGYIIELVPYAGQSEMEEKAGTTSGATYFYRITAIGFGLRQTTQVVLQTFYRKADDDPAIETHLPAGRSSWREIPNWKELHDAFEKT